MRRGKDGGTTGVVEGEEEVEVEEEEVGERLAHREGRRRLVGRAGLEKFFWTEEEGTEDPSLSCGETNELPFRITLLYQQSVSHTQILYILSRVPSVVFLTLGKTTGTFQTETLIHSARKCGKVTHPFSFGQEKTIWTEIQYLTHAAAVLLLTRTSATSQFYLEQCSFG